jgi:hypothetical protein
VLTDDDGSPIQVLCLFEPLVLCEGINGYIRLSPSFKVCQTLVKRGTVSETLDFRLLELTVRRRTAGCRPNQGDQSHTDSGKQVRVLLESVSCRSYPIGELGVSNAWWDPRWTGERT